MPRVVEITVPSEQTDSMVTRIRDVPDVISLRVQRGISLQPIGDVIEVEITNHHLADLMRVLDEARIGRTENTSITSSRPLSVVSPPSTGQIIRDTSEATWEEMDMSLAKEGNTTANMLGLMLVSGFAAAIGVLNDSLHIVVGAMVIAPGFSPLARIGLSIATESKVWKGALVDTLKAYAVLIGGGALAALLLQLFGSTSSATYLADDSLLNYWTTITPSTVMLAIAASFAGALLIASNREILTAGVMIALALVPTAAIIGASVIQGEFSLAGGAFLNWLIQAASVTLVSLGTFAYKRAKVHKRRAML